MMPLPGTGTPNSTPQEVLFIVSDGVDDEVSSSCSQSLDGNRCQQPFNTTWCTTVKNRGIQIAVLYTDYLPLPTNSWYNNWIAPFQSKIATEYGKLRVAGHVFLGDHRRRYHLGHADAVPAGGRGRAIDEIDRRDRVSQLARLNDGGVAMRQMPPAMTRTALSGRSSAAGNGSSQAKTAEAAGSAQRSQISDRRQPSGQHLGSEAAQIARQDRASARRCAP